AYRRRPRPARPPRRRSRSHTRLARRPRESTASSSNIAYARPLPLHDNTRAAVNVKTPRPAPLFLPRGNFPKIRAITPATAAIQKRTEDGQMRDGMRIGRTRTAIVVALVALAAATFFHAPDDEVFAADNEVAAFYRDGMLVVSVPEKAIDSSGVGE